MEVIDLTEDDEEEELPANVDYDGLCHRFVELTGTDNACGHMFLQTCKWDLTEAVNTFFEVVYQQASSADADTDTQPRSTVSEIKILSWNIDGLNERSRTTRAKAVATYVCHAFLSMTSLCNTSVEDVVLESSSCGGSGTSPSSQVKDKHGRSPPGRSPYRELPTFVFFQEVVTDSLAILDSMLNDRYVCYSGSRQRSYFTAIFIRKDVAKCTGSNIVPFSRTSMGREMLIAELEVGTCQCMLIATHLESTADFKANRIKQLNEMYAFVTEQVGQEKTVFFGGDLNLRDSEFLASRCGTDRNSKVVDLWEACGSPSAEQYTWDCAKNDTVQMPGKFLPRKRFDRLYMKSASTPLFKPKEFRLVGNQRIRSTMCFPSDHFGILAVLDVSLAG